MIAATPTFCPIGAKARAEITFRKSDLARLARRASGPRGSNAITQIPAAKEHLIRAVTVHDTHVTECPTCNEKFA